MEKDFSKTLSLSLIMKALKVAFFMFHPKYHFRNPVMFIVWLASVLITLLFFISWSYFDAMVASLLWLTLYFGNFSQSLADGLYQEAASRLSKGKVETTVKKLKAGKESLVSSLSLKKGDFILCKAGELIPADGEVIAGVATVDESSITGESAPVIRESEGDRNFVTAGSKLLSDTLVIKITGEPGRTLLDKITHAMEDAEKQCTAKESLLNTLLSGFSLLFLLSTVSLHVFSLFGKKAEAFESIPSVTMLTVLLICSIPTTIAALLNTIRITAMDHLIRLRVIAKSCSAIEAAGDIDLLILDKTGTITMGERLAWAFFPNIGVKETALAKSASLASLSDQTPEGRSIVALAKNKFGIRAEESLPLRSRYIPFSAKTRMSGVDFLDEQGTVIRKLRKGAVDTILEHVGTLGGSTSKLIQMNVHLIAKNGGTPLLVSDEQNIIGIIHLKDTLKGGIKKKLQELRKMGIRTVMMTGDNPVTAAVIAAEAGVDDFIAPATPETKLEYIKKEQKKGYLVAMTGDGVNDAPALAQADVAVAMNSGAEASIDAGTIVDLESNPAKLIDIVEIGKEILITRGALTIFSLSSTIAKYFAIIPAIFSTYYLFEGEVQGALSQINIMSLTSPESAIISTLTFNALVILALLPLALKGVPYKYLPMEKILKLHLIIYGLGGVLIPFIGIKAIDLLLSFFWYGV